MSSETTATKRVPLLRYWATRYLLALLAGLLVIGGISAVWISRSADRSRMDLMALMADEVGDRLSGDMGEGPFLGRLLENRSRMMDEGARMSLIITDAQGRPLFVQPRRFPPDIAAGLFEALKAGRDRYVIRTRNRDRSGENRFLMVSRRLDDGRRVILLSPARSLGMEPQDLQFLLAMLLTVAVTGLVVIHLFLRKLSKPIGDVAAAAKRLMAHDYDIRLDPGSVREQEVYDLVSSFQEMSSRLSRLESIRTELLAGVTHELKTPVASISGLVTAVRDKVVTGDEADEFLSMSAAEAKRLQKMVEDLLEFNSFAVGALPVNMEAMELQPLIGEIAHQWAITREDARVSLDPPGEPVTLFVDPLRLQQILVNLLNNAWHAGGAGVALGIRVSSGNGMACIDVWDEGPGIPGDEQPLVFERFFRGRDKKHRVRGLGLGLSFSLMAARAMGGDLSLLRSGPKGTVFRLTLPQGDNW